jgi:hypothetical protein
MNDSVKQNTWRIHKGDHRTENFFLAEILEIDLPFWECKQNVIVEKDVEVDRFSHILLELIDSGINTYSEIFNFLGIEEDCFVNIQFHYLLKNRFIKETVNETLEVTLDGKNFMNKKSKAKKTETEEFEFLMLDRFDFIKNDMNNEFFDPSKPIDKASEGKSNAFSGYKLTQTHKKEKTEKDVLAIKHQNIPSYGALASKRSDFSIFFNSQFKEKTFYDFADNKLRQHRRNIRFLALIFISDINSYDIRIDIRQFNSSVKKFDRKFALEEKLSKIVTDYYQKNYDELEEYLPKTESNDLSNRTTIELSLKSFSPKAALSFLKAMERNKSKTKRRSW